MSKDVVRQVLEDMANKLEKGWLGDGVFARDEAGKEVSPLHASASCFCVAGVAQRVVFDLHREDADWILHTALTEIAYVAGVKRQELADWNDRQTQKDVVAAVRQAAKNV